MDFYKTVEIRRSVRKYIAKKVEEEKLERILNAGRLAPSGKNAQAWKFIITREPEIKTSLVEACKGQKFIGEADCILTVCIDETKVYQKHGGYSSSFMVDGAIALEHMILAAAAEGLGTCWIGAYHEDKVREVLNIPRPYRVVGITPLGYPAGEGKSPGRKELAEIVIHETW